MNHFLLTAPITSLLIHFEIHIPPIPLYFYPCCVDCITWFQKRKFLFNHHRFSAMHIHKEVGSQLNVFFVIIATSCLAASIMENVFGICIKLPSTKYTSFSSASFTENLPLRLNTFCLIYNCLRPSLLVLENPFQSIPFSLLRFGRKYVSLSP